MESDARVFEIGDRVRYLSATADGTAEYGEGRVVSVSSGFVDVETDSGYLVGIAVSNVEKLPAKE